jgi:hypothetical protein
VRGSVNHTVGNSPTVGDRWSSDNSEERRAKLDAILLVWDVGRADRPECAESPIDGVQLGRADVFCLVKHATPSSRGHVPQSHLEGGDRRSMAPLRRTVTRRRTTPVSMPVNPRVKSSTSAR